jgi:hypothetical protein
MIGVTDLSLSLAFRFIDPTSLSSWPSQLEAQIQRGTDLDRVKGCYLASMARPSPWRRDGSPASVAGLKPESQSSPVGRLDLLRIRVVRIFSTVLKGSNVEGLIGK